MRLSEHKSAVGLFTVVAVAILIFGIMALGGGRLFSRDTTFNIWFDTSVSGLSLGAPVVFRGVDLGTVTGIGLAVTSDMSNALIPVTVRINTENLVQATKSNGEGEVSDEWARTVIRHMVDQGMRAKLQMSSMITGQYRIDLGFHTNDTPVYRSGDPSTEIPSISSSMDSVTRALEQMPIEDMVADLEQTLNRLGAIVMSGEIERALTGFADAMEGASALLAELRPLPATLNTLLADADRAVLSVSRTLSSVDGAVSTVGDGLPPTMAAFQLAMTDLAGAARELRALVARTSKELGPQTRMYVELEKLLKEFNTLSRSVRSLSNTIERNPEVLIQGRKGAY